MGEAALFSSISSFIVRQIIVLWGHCCTLIGLNNGDVRHNADVGLEGGEKLNNCEFAFLVTSALAAATRVRNSTTK